MESGEDAVEDAGEDFVKGREEVGDAICEGGHGLLFGEGLLGTEIRMLMVGTFGGSWGWADV